MKGKSQMNYKQWANEYKENALKIEEKINELKKQKREAKAYESIEIDHKIWQYKTIYNEQLNAVHTLTTRADVYGEN